jgi:hypothetical protein
MVDENKVEADSCVQENTYIISHNAMRCKAVFSIYSTKTFSRQMDFLRDISNSSGTMCPIGALFQHVALPTFFGGQQR